MARITLTLLPILLSLLYISSKANSATPTFIKTKCSKTTYPSLCEQSLLVYASTIQSNPRQLIQTALSVSLQKAQFTKAYMTKLTRFKGLKKREYAAIKDCLEEMSDDVDRLTKSVNEIKKMGKPGGNDFIWHISNVETWVSAALTDGNTCIDGFSGKAMNGRIKTSVKAQVTTVAQVTSNALALITEYAATY